MQTLQNVASKRFAHQKRSMEGLWDIRATLHEHLNDPSSFQAAPISKNGGPYGAVMVRSTKPKGPDCPAGVIALFEGDDTFKMNIKAKMFWSLTDPLACSTRYISNNHITQRPLLCLSLGSYSLDIYPATALKYLEALQAHIFCNVLQKNSPLLPTNTIILSSKKHIFKYPTIIIVLKEICVQICCIKQYN